MFQTLMRKANEFSRLLIVRVLLIAVLSFLSVAIAYVFSPLIPDGMHGLIGAAAVDRILSVIANSMLTVTTFSLAVMAATHRSVSGMWTPRAHQIMLQDTTTHTVLATFIGAYLYALNAIVLRETDVFREDNLVVLFGMTLLVAAMIIVAIIRWVRHLEMFGSLIQTAQRIEDQTAEAWDLRMRRPRLGCQSLATAVLPDQVYEVYAPRSGYVQQVYQEMLENAAKEANAHIWIDVQIGAFYPKGRVIAQTDRADPDLHDIIARQIAIGSLRNYPQDPAFGLLNLSEIASRALSPGVNDPGTAIDCIQRMARVMHDTQPYEIEPSRFQRLFMADFDAGGTLNRIFGPVLRDSLDAVEVTDALQDALCSLATHQHAGLAAAAAELGGKLRAGLAPDVPPVSAVSAPNPTAAPSTP
ncbi:DUF2254 domain-containing protein [Pseudooceanicola sp.]|uniref:DUF2254 domain-containing protein n=1 Tax=Pseudooceanicola sp. TaxID=1914328 RepID=UPI0026160E84|nr:DUF2254 domain-containing protein [Pseudooceanicola sp.]MDF1855814.1 DUF2254 domain-containing protein [Pseudooceanicola sp.]